VILIMYHKRTSIGSTFSSGSVILIFEDIDLHHFKIQNKVKGF